MMFFGDFLCGNAMSIPCTPTDIDNIIKVELSDAWYDDLRITKNIEEELSSAINQDWDWDTILHAKFDFTTSAGNVIWTYDTVSHLLVKRKKVDDFKWITLEVRKVENIDDFNLRNIDKTAIPNFKYQYAAVPIKNGVEGFYSTCDVDVKSNCLVIVDRDEIWATPIHDGFFDATSITPNSKLETQNSLYPSIVRNTIANYEEISVNAQFLYNSVSEDGECVELDLNDEKAIMQYNNKAKMFLRNGNFKIAKTSDSRCWGVYITTPPTDSAENDYRNRKLSFTMTESFDIHDEESLWEYGLLDESVTEEWWSK